MSKNNQGTRKTEDAPTEEKKPKDEPRATQETTAE